MAKQYVWEVYLRPNTLSRDSGVDCVAEVHQHNATRHNGDIADRIVQKRSEFRRETILSILEQRDQEAKLFLLEGDSFRDGLAQFSPRVSGVWETAGAAYDPAVHRRTVDMVMTADLRTSLEAVGVHVLGGKAESAKITTVTDTATGRKDGFLTVGDDIIIEGERIKVDEADVEQGVFIVDAAGAEHKVVRRLTVNKPSQLIARIPADVPVGEVSVLVRTRYTGSGGVALKELREVRYAHPCKAVM